MKQETASGGAPLQWLRTINTGYYINSAAISRDGALVVAGTFFHSYEEGKPTSTADNGTFGTYCFNRDGD